MNIISKILEKLGNERKKYAMPGRVGFIKWTPETERGGYPIKRIELHSGEKTEILPFISMSQVRIIEKERSIPIIDMTGGASPKIMVTDEFDPTTIEISRF